MLLIDYWKYTITAKRYKKGRPITVKPPFWDAFFFKDILTDTGIDLNTLCSIDCRVSDGQPERIF
jgi:hypothetical protein